MRVFCDNLSCTAMVWMNGACNETNRNAQLRRDGWSIHYGRDEIDPGYDIVLCPRCTKETT